MFILFSLITFVATLNMGGKPQTHLFSVGVPQHQHRGVSKTTRHQRGRQPRQVAAQGAPLVVIPKASRRLVGPCVTRWSAVTDLVAGWSSHAYLKDRNTDCENIVQELCESRGGRPGLSVLTSLVVSVDVKQY